MGVSNFFLADSALGASASPPSSKALNSAASIGDVIIVDVILPNASGPGTVSVSDNLGNSYSPFGTVLNDTTHNKYIAKFWTQVTVAGTPTVSASLGTAKTGRIEIKRFTGFVGTPTVDTTLATTASGSVASGALTTVSAAAATSHNNTLILATIADNDVSYQMMPTGMWAPSSPDTMNTGGAFYGYSFYSPQADSGGTVPFSFAPSATTSYGASIAALYDSGSSLPTGIRVRQWTKIGPNPYSASPNPITGNFPQATLAGSALVAFVYNSDDHAGNYYQASDPVNGNWTQLDLIVNSTSDLNGSDYLFQNAAAVPATDNISFTGANAADDLYMVALEIAGATASCLIAHTAQLQTAVTSTAADFVTSGAMAGGSAAALVLGSSTDLTGNNTTQENAPVPGTGYTGYGWYFWPATQGAPGDGNVATFEYQRFASPGSPGATFTVPNTSSDNYVTFGIVLAEALLPHQPPTPFVLPQLPPTWEAQHGAKVAPLIPLPPSPYSPFRRLQLPPQLIEWDAQVARRIAPLIPHVATYIPALRRLQQDIAALEWPAQRTPGFATTIQPAHSFSYTMAGGLLLSGSAPRSDVRVATPAGGLVFDGTAPYSAIHSFSYTMAGGATFAGTALLNIVRNVTPAGGLAFGGSAPVIFVQQGAGKSLLPITGVGK